MKTSMKIGIGVFLAVVVVGIIVGISVMNSEPTQNEPIQNGGNNVVTDNKEENNTQVNTELTVEAVKRAKETPASQFEYEDVEGGVAITGYNGKAEIVVIIIVSTTPTIVTKTLFATYHEKGIVDSAVWLKRLVKLSKVGFLGINLGGHSNSSLVGFNACEKINKIGRAIKIAIGIKITKNLI